MYDGVALNLGAGGDIRADISGFKCINVDSRDLPGIDVVCDIHKLDFEDNSVDYVLASDIIEHFPISDTINLLKEWTRVLKIGGIMKIRTPDLEYLAEHYMRHRDAEFVSYHIFGGQDYPTNFHYVIFDGKMLQSICQFVGLHMIDFKKEITNFVITLKKF